MLSAGRFARRRGGRRFLGGGDSSMVDGTAGQGDRALQEPGTPGARAFYRLTPAPATKIMAKERRPISHRSRQSVPAVVPLPPAAGAGAAEELSSRSHAST